MIGQGRSQRFHVEGQKLIDEYDCVGIAHGNRGDFKALVCGFYRIGMFGFWLRMTGIERDRGWVKLGHGHRRADPVPLYFGLKLAR